MANTPNEKEVIKLLEEAIASSKVKNPADFFLRFYRGLNKIGNWGSPKEREHVFTTVKDAVKKTFRDQGPEGAKLADMLESANSSWMKYLDAEDFTKMMGKATSEEALNLKKLSNLLDNPDNYQVAKQALGPENASHLKLMSNTGKSIEQFEKALKGGLTKQFVNHGHLLGILQGMLTFNFHQAGLLLGTEMARRLGTQILTNPKLQNIQQKMVTAFNENNFKALRIYSEEAEKILNPVRKQDKQKQKQSKR